MIWPRLRPVGVIALIAAVYFVAGRLGLELAYVHESATAVWAPTGISLAALLIFGTRFWPGVFLGAFLANVTNAGNIASSIGIATGNTLEAVLGTMLVVKYANGRDFLQQPFAFLRFVLFAALGSTVVSATVGVGSLTAFGLASPERFWNIWINWWLGDASGALFFTPLIIAWHRDPHLSWTRKQALEATCLLVSLGAFSELVFGGWAPEPFAHFPFLATPLLLWPAFRFGPRETTAALLVVFALALAGTLEGSGPFASATPFATLFAMQTFIGVLALTSLAVASTNAARLHSTAELEHSQQELEAAIALLAAECKHDPLTGIANRRGFAERLRAEAERSRRRAEPLAMLVVDIDKFRRHNQELGHGAADQVLRSVARLLRGQIRACDHLSRFGGDEFVMLLPGTDLAGARTTAERCRRAVENAEWGRRHVTVSIGATAFRVDADREDDLLAMADQALFRAKAAGRNRVATLGVRAKAASARAIAQET